MIPWFLFWAVFVLGSVFRLHAMLFTMMRLCPKTRTEMFPIIASKFPFWTNSAPILTFYIVQAFRVMDYLPSIRRNLLEIVIDKCLEMDVNIKIKGNGEVSIEEGKSENEQDEVEETPTDETEKETSVDEAVDKLSDKLDSCLAVLFETIKRGCKDFTSVRELYYDILPVFESTILTTHKSKFVQYCMFLLCCLESQLLSDEERLMKITSPGQQPNDHAILHRDFAAKLIDIIVDPYRATMTRQSGACYLASFISRSSYVGPETLCESVSALLRWAEAYIDSVVAVRAADSREQSELHSLFYTVCQAAFYIMSFRGPEAIKFYREVSAGYTAGTESPDDNEAFFMPDPEHIDMGSKRWTTICSHNLQPLRFCLESVRSEFLHIAHAYDLIDEQVLDKLVADAKHLSTGRVNKKAAFKISTAATLEKQRETGGVGGLGRGSNPLKSFFPFDPLLLRRSHDYIEKYYTHWQGSCEEEDVLVIDDGSEGEEDPIFEMDENMESNEASDDEADGEDDEDGLPVVVSDQETREDNEYDMDESMRTPDAQVKKENQRRAWTETLKRPRSLSIENGSW